MSSGPTTAVLAVLWIVLIHALEANFLNPKIMGTAAKIHPVLVVLALVIGEHFYGLAGALFAVPLMSALVTIWKALRQRAMQIDAEIGSNEPVVAAHGSPLTRPVQRLRDGDGG
jgi:predicted PurR-regulated permease PerM